MIVFLDGPINAGKSTVGAMLASELGQGVHIEVDQLRRFARGLSLEQAIPFALADAAELTKIWANRGYHVVVSWPIDHDNHRHFVTATTRSDVPFHTFTLLPALEIALAGRGTRRLTEKERARIRKMYARMYAGDRPVGFVIDNSQQTPAETVRSILSHIEADSRRVDVDLETQGRTAWPMISSVSRSRPTRTSSARKSKRSMTASPSIIARAGGPAKIPWLESFAALRVKSSAACWRRPIGVGSTLTSCGWPKRAAMKDTAAG